VASYGHIAKLFVDGEPYGDLTRDDILDNITLSWLTNTGVSCARLYREYKGAFFTDFKISVPAAISVFPEGLPSSAELGGAGVSQTDALQQAGERRPLCSLGTAEGLFRRGSYGLQITTQK
jgi:hypothetical protein